MIKLSENAEKKIQQLLEEESREGETFLRVSVKAGGCSGFSYKLDFDTESKEGDKVFDSENGLAKLVIDSKSLLYLIGMTLDYEGGLNGNGFVFSNPNATKTCGCGASFAV